MRLANNQTNEETLIFINNWYRNKYPFYFISYISLLDSIITTFIFFASFKGEIVIYDLRLFVFIFFAGIMNYCFISFVYFIMADLNSIGSRISKVGENVGTRLDGIAKKFLDSTNLKVDLQNVFQETGLNTAKLNEKMNELQLPEVYKNAASFLVQNQKAFE